MRDGIGDIKADAARAHNRHALADRLVAFQHINIADRFFVIYAFNIGHTRGDAGGHHHMPKIAQHIGVSPRVEAQLNAQLVNHFAVIAQRFVKLFLAGHQLGEVELPPNLVSRINERYLMAALRRRGGISQSGGARADNGDVFRLVGRLIFKQRLMTGTRID